MLVREIVSVNVQIELSRNAYGSVYGVLRGGLN